MGGGYLGALCKALHGHKLLAFDSKPNYTQGVRTRSYLNTPAYTLSPDLARLTYVCMYG